MPLYKQARHLPRSERSVLLRVSEDSSVTPPSFSLIHSPKIVKGATSLLKTIAGVLIITGVERAVACVLATLGLSLPTAPVGKARLGQCPP